MLLEGMNLNSPPVQVCHSGAERATAWLFPSSASRQTSREEPRRKTDAHAMPPEAVLKGHVLGDDVAIRPTRSCAGIQRPV